MDDLNEYSKFVIDRLELNSKGYVRARESSKLEFKESFNWSNKAKYAKIANSFANNSGGFIIFGIKDNPHSIVGIDDKFRSFDTQSMDVYFSDIFSNVLNYESGVEEVGGIDVGWFYFYASSRKPVVFRKNDNRGEFNDGDIFYRYGSSSKKIAGGDLSDIINARIQNGIKELVGAMRKISNIGIENVSILNLMDGVGDLPDGRRIIISDEVLEKVKFIKDGEISEREGSPTLRVVGDVSTAAALIEKKVDPEIKFNLFTKEVGLELGFPERSAVNNALALIYYFNLNTPDYRYVYKSGMCGSRTTKYSRKVIETIRIKIAEKNIDIDNDSKDMIKIRKKYAARRSS